MPTFERSHTISLYRNPVTGLGQSVDPAAPFTQGSSVTMPSVTGANTEVAAFTKPQINATAIGVTPASADGYNYSNTLGYPFTVQNDADRGKVLYNTQDPDNYNSVLRHTFAPALAENAKHYAAFWFKASLMLEGSRYTLPFQLKNGRFTYQDSITDNTLCELKLHTQDQGLGSDTNLVIVVTNNVGNGGTNKTFYGGQKADINNTWFLMEVFVETGTVAGDNGRATYRLMQNGVNYIQADHKNLTLYGGSERFGWFNEQGYFGNFDNNGPIKPDNIQVWRDSSAQIRGHKRVDLCDSLNTMTSTMRQNQKWSIWGASEITVPSLDLTGIPSGARTMYLREINGIDSAGNDIVASYREIEVSK